MLVAIAAAILALLLAIHFVRRQPPRAAEELDAAQAATALLEQSQAALQSDRFEEAARLAQEAIDIDPLAPGPRKSLAQARREQESQKAWTEALSKAQLGREDEALRLLAQVPPQSRLFARARIKAKDLGQAMLRVHGASALGAAARAVAHSARDDIEQLGGEHGVVALRK